MKENITHLILAVLIVPTAMFWIDWVSFCLKKAPRTATLTKTEHTIGLVASVVLLYFVLNGYKWI